MSEEIKKELARDEIIREHELMSKLGAIVSGIEDTGQQLKFHYEKRSIDDKYLSSGFVFRNYIKEPKLTPEQKLESENNKLKKQIGQLQDLIASKDEINGARLRIIDSMRNCLNCDNYKLSSFYFDCNLSQKCKTSIMEKDHPDYYIYWTIEKQKEVKDGK